MKLCDSKSVQAPNRGEITCSHKDSTQQHQHSAAAKNKHWLKVKQTQQKNRDPPLSTTVARTDACTTRPPSATSAVNRFVPQCDSL